MSGTNNTIVTVGLMAYGMSGKIFHAPFLAQHTGFKLKAVVERSAQRAQNDYPTIQSYASLSELVNDEEIDLVVINTPNNLHFEHAKMALTHGKHILVEKPFTATVVQAKELFALADKHGKQIFVYQNRRWDSDFLSVKQVIESNQLGKLNEVHFRFDRYRNEIGIKAFKEMPVAASGLLYDLGPHLLDQVISLFGAPEKFHKITGKNRLNTQVDDFFSIQLQYANSLTVFVTASMLVVNPQAAFILHGTKGSFVKNRADVQEEQLVAGLKLDDTQYGYEQESNKGVLTTIEEKGQKTEVFISAEKASYMPLFDAVYQSLITGADFPISRADVLAVLTILESPDA
ncbi:Gfo/Idh/MocA family oxidoreductase [Pedobacter sp. MW01-1-1]|uniref:Gfo/Idh/MocA family oxidoreductase n=1 Tax=Pedobacter sp. MW01-1-1 TaxID=3383027 RepID=UPI003FF0A80F